MDSLALKLILCGLADCTEAQKKVADVDKNGNVNSLDSYYLKCYISGKIQEL